MVLSLGMPWQNCWTLLQIFLFCTGGKSPSCTQSVKLVPLFWDNFYLLRPHYRINFAKTLKVSIINNNKIKKSTHFFIQYTTPQQLGSLVNITCIVPRGSQQITLKAKLNCRYSWICIQKYPQEVLPRRACLRNVQSQ